jgi:ABC-type dipeptide/oligopeptide/nickel transport system permease subunit
MGKKLRTYWPVLFFLLLAIGAPLLSNNKPLVVKDQFGWFFPAFSGKDLSNTENVEFKITAPIPYSPSDINLDETGRAPNETHWLGTDAIGRDVLANIIHGFRTSIFIATLAILIALIIGLSIGAAAGFWDSRAFQINHFQTFAFILFIAFVWNFTTVIYFLYGSAMAVIFTLIFLTLMVFILKLLSVPINRLKLKKSFLPEFLKFNIYPGSYLMWLINSIAALPAYFVLLAMLALFPNPGLTSIALILGLLMWTDIARLTRAEIIRLKTTNMAESAKALGFSEWRIILKHLLPNAMQPALTAIGFGIGGAILAEAFLSFVGIAPAEMISWGALISQAREYPSFWWLSVFPGAAIFMVILVFYRFSLKLGNQKAHVH